MVSISWTNQNPEMRFHSCQDYKREGCGFAWEDPPMCARAKTVIPGLLARCSRFEEEIKRMKKVEEEIIHLRRKFFIKSKRKTPTKSSASTSCIRPPPLPQIPTSSHHSQALSRIRTYLLTSFRQPPHGGCLVPGHRREVLHKNDIVLSNRPRFIAGKYFGYNYTTLVASPYGEHWRNLRRLTTVEIFSTARLNVFQSIRHDENKLLLKQLYGKSCQDFARVELRSMLSELTFNVIMRMVAGKRYFGEDEEYDEANQFRRIHTSWCVEPRRFHPGVEMD
ncbi:cytochrome [Sesamum angolense]|uniref:Cytochrome n=1 Tax=Sesamum angolense TaxID=2727404 RepID=A0AAE2BNB3_9LAMI|nr:cytochrome [Sesamum angolense]